MSSKIDGVALTTLEEFANHERRLRKPIVGDRPPTPEELELNSDPLDGTRHKGHRSSKPSPNELREWWAAVSETWLAYSREAARQQAADPVAELAGIMGRVAGELSRGIVPSYIADVVVRGRRPIFHVEAHDIGVAVAYRLACEPEGFVHNGRVIRIQNSRPTRDIADAYEVREATVRGWVRDHRPAFLGVNDVDAHWNV
jgi:hypothetical protein